MRPAHLSKRRQHPYQVNLPVHAHLEQQRPEMGLCGVEAHPSLFRVIGERLAGEYGPGKFGFGDGESVAQAQHISGDELPAPLPEFAQAQNGARLFAI